MDIDTDWCLTCERRLEYSDRLYCSPECQPERRKERREDSTIFHVVESTSQWAGNDYAGISAWAAQIPIGAAPSSPPPPPPPHTPSLRLPPNLIKPSRRLAPPALSVNSPQSPTPILPPSTPILTPKRQPSFVCPIQTRTSLQSAATESSLVATPPPSKPVPILSTSRKQPSVFEGVYTHFLQSWASHSPPLGPTNLPPFPPLPHPQYKPPGATRRLKIVSPSSLAASEQQVVFDEHDHHPSFRTRGRKASRVAA